MAEAGRIVERILEQAQLTINDIEAEADKKAQEILDKAEKDGEAQANTILKKGLDAANEQKRRILALSDMEKRKAILQSKSNSIKELYDKALLDLAKYKGTKWEALNKKLLLDSVETGDETILPSANDAEKFTPEFINNINAGLKAIGKKGEMKLGDKQNGISGGFLLDGGSFMKNCSYEEILDKLFEQIEPEIAKILFATEGID